MTDARVRQGPNWPWPCTVCGIHTFSPYKICHGCSVTERYIDELGEFEDYVENLS